MSSKFSSNVLLVTHLAHDLHFRAILLDVIIELSSGHMLVLFSVANIASKFGAGELGVGLKFSQGLPDDFPSSVLRVAPVREFTKVDTISKYLVNFLHEVSSGLAVWTTDIKPRSLSLSSVEVLRLRFVLRRKASLSSSTISSGRNHLSLFLLRLNSRLSHNVVSWVGSWINGVVRVRSHWIFHWSLPFLELELAILAE